MVGYVGAFICHDGKCMGWLKIVGNGPQNVQRHQLQHFILNIRTYYLSALFNQPLSSGQSNPWGLKSCMKLLSALSCPWKAMPCLPRNFTFCGISGVLSGSPLCLEHGHWTATHQYLVQSWARRSHLYCILMALTLFMSTKSFCGILPVGESLLYKWKIFWVSLQLTFFLSPRANMAESSI